MQQRQKEEEEEEEDKLDLHAELQRYLNSLNITDVLVHLVENILTEKPANPHTFTIEYLYGNHTALAQESIDRLNVLTKSKKE